MKNKKKVLNLQCIPSGRGPVWANEGGGCKTLLLIEAFIDALS